VDGLERLTGFNEEDYVSTRAKLRVTADQLISLVNGNTNSFIKSMIRLLPGVGLCVALTLAALLVQAIEVGVVGQPYLEALVMALVLGVAMRTAWTPGSYWNAGIQFSAKILLETAVVLLGASVSASAAAAMGPALIFGIGCVVVVAIATSYAICRFVGLPLRMSILVACGNSICGNSAIAAVAPIIGADSDDVASSIAFTAVLGVVVVLGLPFLVPVLQMTLTQYGVLAGLTVYAVPQVVAATLPIGALSNQVGTVVKLIRVLMLGPVVLGLSLVSRRLSSGPQAGSNMPGTNTGRRSRPTPLELVPWFILGFLIVAAARSFGLIPQSILFPLATTASILTTVSMAALGLGVDVRAVASAGVRVTAAVTVSLVVLGIISLGLIRLLEIS
jgi:uncharacterized integral membrane protein (TIGR00698 family)